MDKSMWLSFLAHPEYFIVLFHVRVRSYAERDIIMCNSVRVSVCPLI